MTTSASRQRSRPISAAITVTAWWATSSGFVGGFAGTACGMATAITTSAPSERATSAGTGSVTPPSTQMRPSTLTGTKTPGMAAEACTAWARKAFEAMAPYATGGTYVNFMTDDEDRARAAYGANYERLARLKKRYDPTNLFRMNQNVPPAGA